MELIANAVKWHYISYDHKAAMDEIRGNMPKNHKFFHQDVPDEMKKKYAHMKIGKLRSMRFDPDGMVERMYVGRSNKFCKRFFPQDVGDTIKPILNPNDDKFGLLQAGLAVDETKL